MRMSPQDELHGVRWERASAAVLTLGTMKARNKQVARKIPHRKNTETRIRILMMITMKRKTMKEVSSGPDWILKIFLLTESRVLLNQVLQLLLLTQTPE